MYDEKYTVNSSSLEKEMQHLDREQWNLEDHCPRHLSTVQQNQPGWRRKRSRKGAMLAQLGLEGARLLCLVAEK